MDGFKSTCISRFVICNCAIRLADGAVNRAGDTGAQAQGVDSGGRKNGQTNNLRCQH